MAFQTLLCGGETYITNSKDKSRNTATKMTFTMTGHKTDVEILRRNQDWRTLLYGVIYALHYSTDIPTRFPHS